MYSSLKIREADKEALDRLLHEYILRTGERISLHELVARLLRFALASKEEFLRAGEARPRSRRKDWRRYQFDLPAATDASEVDRVVYGLDP